MINFLKGIIIGLAFIIPGVSGGTLMVMMGLYDKTIDAIINFFSNVKKNSVFLLKIGGGALVGVLLFSKILNFLLNNYECPTKFVFIGLIIGGIPATYKTIIQKKDASINWMLVFLTVSISVILFVVEKVFINYSIEQELLIGHIPFLAICLAGILYASGKVIPGISGAALLMLIGMYNFLINTVANITTINMSTVKILMPFILSFLISCLILFKLINYLIKKHYSTTYSLILGFIIGSVIYIIPNLNIPFWNIILSLVLGLLAMIMVYNISIKKPV